MTLVLGEKAKKIIESIFGEQLWLNRDTSGDLGYWLRKKQKLVHLGEDYSSLNVL